MEHWNFADLSFQQFFFASINLQGYPIQMFTNSIGEIMTVAPLFSENCTVTRAFSGADGPLLIKMKITDGYPAPISTTRVADLLSTHSCPVA
jgi:hypothetical protein